MLWVAIFIVCLSGECRVVSYGYPTKTLEECQAVNGEVRKAAEAQYGDQYVAKATAFHCLKVEGN